jgi:hypothetical protein
MVCGDNKQGALGLKAPEGIPQLTTIHKEQFNNDSVVKASCGYYHTVLLTRKGHLYGAGQNTHRQLGIDQANDSMFGFSPVNFPHDETIVDVSSGLKHTLVLTCMRIITMFFVNNNSASGRVYGTGSNAKQELVAGDTFFISEFTVLNLPAPIRCILAGPFYSMFCSLADEVFIIGKNSWMQMGDKEDLITEIKRSEEYSEQRIIQMMGYLSTACRTGTK